MSCFFILKRLIPVFLFPSEQKILRRTCRSLVLYQSRFVFSSPINVLLRLHWMEVTNRCPLKVPFVRMGCRIEERQQHLQSGQSWQSELHLLKSFPLAFCQWFDQDVPMLAVAIVGLGYLLLFRNGHKTKLPLSGVIVAVDNKANLLLLGLKRRNNNFAIRIQRFGSDNLSALVVEEICLTHPKESLVALCLLSPTSILYATGMPSTMEPMSSTFQKLSVCWQTSKTKSDHWKRPFPDPLYWNPWMTCNMQGDQVHAALSRKACTQEIVLEEPVRSHKHGRPIFFKDRRVVASHLTSTHYYVVTMPECARMPIQDSDGFNWNQKTLHSYFKTKSKKRPRHSPSSDSLDMTFWIHVYVQSQLKRIVHTDIDGRQFDILGLNTCSIKGTHDGIVVAYSKILCHETIVGPSESVQQDVHLLVFE